MHSCVSASAPLAATAKHVSVTCPYCSAAAELVDGATVKTKHKHVWLCWRCHAWTGVYPDSPRMKPMGRLANESLRAARSRAFVAFDAAWKSAVALNGWTKTKARKTAIGFLAQQINVKPATFDMGQLTEGPLLKIAELCNSMNRRRGG